MSTTPSLQVQGSLQLHQKESRWCKMGEKGWGSNGQINRENKVNGPVEKELSHTRYEERGSLV